jgi:hypothetical protein
MEAGGKSDVEAHGLSLLAESGQSEHQTDDGLNTEIATKGHNAAGPVFHERKSIKRAQEDPPRSICCRGWRMDDYLRECRQKKIVADGFRLLVVGRLRSAVLRARERLRENARPVHSGPIPAKVDPQPRTRLLDEDANVLKP